MRKKQNVTLDELVDDSQKLKKDKVKVDLKREFIKFFKNKINVYFVVSVVISIIMILICTIPTVNTNKQIMSSSSYIYEPATILEELWSRSKIVFLTMVSGIVPWVYTAIMGVISFMYIDISDYAKIIVESGYFIGILKLIVPLLLDVVAISLTAATAMYLSKIASIKYKLSKLNATNWTTIKMKFFQMTGNEKKYNMSQNKLDEKRSSLEKENTKINWRMVFTSLGLSILIELVVVVIKQVI